MTRLMIGLFLSALVVLSAPTASAEPVAQPTPTVVAPTGPTLAPATEEDSARTRNKVVIGVTAAVLLGIVIYGNRVRAKRRKG